MKKTILGFSLIALLSGEINNSYSQNHKSSDNSKLVIYGESNHMSEKQKDFLINSADSLKKEGYNYFAIELPEKYDSSIQRYFASNKNYQDENINKLLELYQSNGALEVAYNFYKNGFKIVPIDKGESFYFVNFNFFTPKIIKNSKRKINNERDFYMAENVEEILEKDKSAKIVAYTGAFHARQIKHKEKLKNKKREYTFTYKYPTMAGILKKKRVDLKTICLIDKNNNGYFDFEKERLNKYFDKIIYLE